MAILDFKEIPMANTGQGNQDRFELLAREFFVDIFNFKVLSQPNRGPDGGKDILFEEEISGALSAQKIKWLVSCKHLAHTGKSVTPDDELNITDRLEQHKADGFIGFYSTLPSSGLNNRLDSFKPKYRIEIFDCERIEKFILNSQRKLLMDRFFPCSLEKWMKIDNIMQLRADIDYIAMVADIPSFFEERR